MDQMRIDPAYRDVLAACRLERVSDVLARLDGRVAAWSRSTETLHVEGPDGTPGFYVKRYYYRPWRKRLRGAFRGTFFGMHRGQAEYASLETMRSLGVHAARPVAFGARRKGHFVAACFLITEEVPGACNLTTFASRVTSGDIELSNTQRNTLITRLARLTATMHAAGFSHGQLFWRNILVRLGLDGMPELFVLDAQPKPAWRRWVRGGTWWHDELAHLLVSALPFARRTERLRLLRAYFGTPRLGREYKQHVREITAAAQGWSRHEKQRIKMNHLFDQWNAELDRELRNLEQPAAFRAHVVGADPAS